MVNNNLSTLEPKELSEILMDRSVRLNIELNQDNKDNRDNDKIKSYLEEIHKIISLITIKTHVEIYVGAKSVSNYKITSDS